MSQKEPEFTIKDKRRFTSDGDSRNEKDSVVQSDSKLKDREADASSSNKAEYQDSSPVNFSSFVMGLGTQTMIMLGEIPHPESGKREVNLDVARQTIDIIAMLEEKTVNNLSDVEKKLLAEILASLRMVYVSKRK